MGPAVREQGDAKPDDLPDAKTIKIKGLEQASIHSLCPICL